MRKVEPADPPDADAIGSLLKEDWDSSPFSVVDCLYVILLRASLLEGF